jgi:hypothetical protein
MHAELPLMLFEYEVSAPFAVPVDLATTPSDYIPKGRRYPVVIQRYQTPAVTKELLELETYQQDLRAILSDNMTKELIALRDYTLMNCVKGILGSSVGTSIPWAGQAMWQNLGTPLTMDSLLTAIDIMRTTWFNIEAAKLLASNLRRSDFTRFILDESQATEKHNDIMFNGLSIENLHGLEVMFTTKKKIVPKPDIFFFGPPEYLGRYVQHTPPTMSIKKDDDHIIRFFQYEIYGMTIAHPGALCAARYL